MFPHLPPGRPGTSVDTPGLPVPHRDYASQDPGLTMLTQINGEPVTRGGWSCVE